jgi:pyruvate formate lyase activating enzyme
MYSALRLYGQEIKPEEAIKILLEDEKFYRHSEGGVTFSGGEPLLQAEFCIQVMSLLREHRIHIAVDTAGDVPLDSIEAVQPYTDLFLFDVKHANSEKHREWTGNFNEQILANLRNLDAAEAAVEIRVPVIPQFNDDEKSLEEIGCLLGNLRNIKAVRLLAYHNMSGSKYAAVGKSYPMPDSILPPSKEDMKKFQRFLSGYCKNVILAGDEYDR